MAICSSSSSSSEVSLSSDSCVSSRCRIFSSKSICFFSNFYIKAIYFIVCYFISIYFCSSCYVSLIRRDSTFWRLFRSSCFFSNFLFSSIRFYCSRLTAFCPSSSTCLSSFSFSEYLSSTLERERPSFSRAICFC